jgi:hypothetical protein
MDMRPLTILFPLSMTDPKVADAAPREGGYNPNLAHSTPDEKNQYFFIAQ